MGAVAGKGRHRQKYIFAHFYKLNKREGPHLPCRPAVHRGRYSDVLLSASEGTGIVSLPSCMLEAATRFEALLKLCARPTHSTECCLASQ